MDFSVHGRTLQVSVYGTGGQVAVLLSALGADATMWSYQIPVIAETMTVVAYETHAPHDQRPHNLPSTLDDYARDLFALMQHLGFERPHLIGLSMGGMIAHQYAIAFPSHVSSLVLASTRASYPPDLRLQFESRALAAETSGMADLVQPTMSRWFTAQFRATHPDVVRSVAGMLGRHDATQYACAARAVANVDTVDRLRSIVVPTQIVRGKEDASTPIESTDVLAERIPESRYAELDGAHLCNMENADHFNSVVLSFLNSSPVQDQIRNH